MENTPEAAGAAPAPQTEATPTNTNPEPAQAPAVDLHGFTSEQLADMQKFFQANGGYEKVKSRISNPTPAPAEEQKPVGPAQPAQPQPQVQEQPRRVPEGMMSQNDLMLKTYSKFLSEEEKYAPIAKEVAKGEYIKEMMSFGVDPYDNNGLIHDGRIRKFLDLKVKNVPATQTAAMPEASPAPTVDYVQVGENITSLNEARAVLRQDAQLRASGQGGHPAIEKAREFLKGALNSKVK